MKYFLRSAKSTKRLGVVCARMKTYFEVIPVECTGKVMQEYAVSMPQTKSPFDALMFSYNMLNLLKSNATILQATRVITEQWSETLYFKNLMGIGLYFRTTGKDHYTLTESIAALLGDCVKTLFFDWRTPTQLYASIIRNHMPNIKILYIDTDNPHKPNNKLDRRIVRNFGRNLNSLFEACGRLDLVCLRLGPLSSMSFEAIGNHINSFKNLKLGFNSITDLKDSGFKPSVITSKVNWTSSNCRLESFDLIYSADNSGNDLREIAIVKKRDTKTVLLESDQSIEIG